MTQTEKIIEEVLEGYEFRETFKKNPNTPHEIDCLTYGMSGTVIIEHSYKLAWALRCAMEALYAIQDSAHLGAKETWTASQLITAIQHDEHEARTALTEIDRIMSGEILEHANKGEGDEKA